MDNQYEVNGIDASEVEHVGALVSGGLMLLSGIRRGGPIGFLFKLAGAGLLYRGAYGYRRLYDAVGLQLPQHSTGVGSKNVRVESSVVVNQSGDDLYSLWRNLQNLPVFMDHLLSVREIDERKSVWVAKAPAGMVVQWQAEIINDIPGELIAWQTLEGSGVDNAGSVHFEDLGDGSTRIRVVLRYSPPADMLGVWIAKIFQEDPQKQIDADLQRFKRFLELGTREPAALGGAAGAG